MFTKNKDIRNAKAFNKIITVKVHVIPKYRVPHFKVFSYTLMTEYLDLAFLLLYSSKIVKKYRMIKNSY